MADDRNRRDKRRNIHSRTTAPIEPDITESEASGEATADLGPPGKVKPRSPRKSRKRHTIELATLERDLYEIDEEFARGGLGRILRARDTRLDRIVAIKELHFDHPSAEARFVREAQLTAQLQHPNIIPVHEAGRWPSGEPFYAMKLVDGKPLGKVISECRTPDERLALVPVVTDVADAIAYAHSKNIIHRDLKPDNVLVGQFGETVVIDWGLAKVIDGDGDSLPPSNAGAPATDYHTTDGAVMGTPAYMPPEQAAGKAVDETADVYSLGAILYELIAGHRPFANKRRSDLLPRVVREPPTSLALLAPDAPPDLVAIVGKAMARDPNDRYPTAREMAEELRRYTAGRLVGAYHYSSLDMIARFVRRQRAAVLTGVIAFGALAAFGAMSIARITEERDKAKQSAVAEATARREAELRFDEAVIERARTLLDTDPTEAAASLKQLVAIRPGAATVAAQAEDAGVSFRIFKGHEDQVSSLAYSPDGRRVVSGGKDKSVRLWDVSGGEPTMLRGHADSVTSTIFSPDGRWVASGDKQGSVRLWDATTYEPRTLGKHGGAVKYLVFSNDSRRLVSVGDDHTVRVWDMASGDSRTLSAPTDRELFASFSPDGDHLVTGSHGWNLRVWDLREGTDRVLRGHFDDVRAGVFSPTGGTVASAGADGTVRLWNPKTGSHRKLTGHAGGASAVAFSGDGRYLASAGMDRIVNVHDLRAGTTQRYEGHTERVDIVIFSPDSGKLASAGWDKTVRLLDLETSDVRVFRGHSEVISALSFAPDGLALVSASWDRTVRLWRLTDASGDGRRVLRGHTVGVHAVAFSPDGRHVASGGHDNAVRLWDTENGSCRILKGHTDHVFRVLYSPDGKWVASSSDDRTVRLWRVADGASRVLRGHTADVEEIAFSPDGTMLASAAEDDTVRLWRVASGDSVVLHHGHHATSVAFSPDAALLATASRDGTVRLWNTKTGEALHVWRDHKDEVWAVAFAPDGRTLASASDDDTVRLWDVATGTSREISDLKGARRLAYSAGGERLAVAGTAPNLWTCDPIAATCTPLGGHRAVVRDLVYATDGRTLITAGGDGTVQISAETSGERRVLEGHTAPVFDIDISPDGKRIASASGDGTVRIWPLKVPPSAVGLSSFLDSLTAEAPDALHLGSAIR